MSKKAKDILESKNSWAKDWDKAFKEAGCFYSKEVIIGLVCKEDEETEKLVSIERFVAVLKAEAGSKKKTWVKELVWPVSETGKNAELSGKYGYPFSYVPVYGYFAPGEAVKPL